MKIEERKQELRQFLQMAKENGCRAFENTREDCAYGWVITPSSNIIYAEYDSIFGLKFALEYNPSKQHGTGCACQEHDTFCREVAFPELEEIEQKGIAFAKQLGAKLYTSEQVEDYFASHWDKENIVEL